MTSQPGRVLALDVGARFVGVAYSDEMGVVAFPDRRLDRQAADFWPRLQQKCQEWQAGTVVLGWPLTLKGEAATQTGQVERFQRQLEEKLTGGVAIVRWDERLSSKEARDLAKAQDKSLAGASRTDEDSLAAYLILQAYLASRGNAAN